MCVQRNVAPNDRSPPSSGKAPPPSITLTMCKSDPFVSWIYNKPPIRKSHFRYYICTNAPIAKLHIVSPDMQTPIACSYITLCCIEMGSTLSFMLCPKSTKIVILLGLIYSTNEGVMMNVEKDVTYTTLS